MNVTIRPATPEDALELATRMRQSDRNEAAIMTSRTPDEAVYYSISHSARCWAMRISGGPLLCLFGVSVDPVAPDVASIWELGTGTIDEHPTAFVRHVRHALRMVMDAMPTVVVFYNFIPEANVRSMNWLRSIGARFNETTTMQNGIPARGFIIERNQKESSHV